MATERYLAAIRGQSNILPRLEENNLKMVHIKEPLADWREWTILTYDQNVLGNLLVRENKLLQKRIDEYEMKLKILTSTPPPPTYAGWPTWNTTVPRSQMVDLDIATPWKENEQ
ncbi:hypothetical protein BT93_C1972 [Corymbia citriodora subsp. variegata]|nr:hypothetical protein BT93_C1972 [Corymbia citriodora subsp. variegata]